MDGRDSNGSHEHQIKINVVRGYAHCAQWWSKAIFGQSNIFHVKNAYILYTDCEYPTRIPQ